MCTQFASTLDLLPTIFNLVGGTIPNDRVIDGYDMAPILFKRGQVCGFTHVHTQTVFSEFHVGFLSVYVLVVKLGGGSSGNR